MQLNSSPSLFLCYPRECKKRIGVFETIGANPRLSVLPRRDDSRQERAKGSIIVVEYLQKEADSSKNIIFLENGVPKIPKIIERKQHRNYIEFHLILIQNQKLEYNWNETGSFIPLDKTRS